MNKLIDLTGQKFGRLTVVSRSENKGTHIYWNCQCDCGNKAIVRGQCLHEERIISCGCTREKMLKKGVIKHNGSCSRLYEIWVSMKKRTLNKKCKDYKHYGEKGITIKKE